MAAWPELTDGELVPDAMSALGDKAGTVEEFADKLAKTSQKSNTSVSQLGEAILTVGGTAKSLAGGTTELNTALGILADNGVKASEGGTAIRNIILSLGSPTTNKAVGAMEDLGLKVYDLDGNMRPLNEVFKDLNESMSEMTSEEKSNTLNAIFNKTDLKSVNALLANCGDRWDELSGYIDESSGAAASMAETMNSGSQGAITTMKSALEGVAITIGQRFLPFVTKAAEFVSNLCTQFQNLSPEAQTTILVVAGIAAAIGPLLIIIGSLISFVGQVGLAFTTLSPIISSAGGLMGLLTGGITGVVGALGSVLAPIVAVVAAIGVFVAALVKAYKENESFRNKVNEVFSQIKSIISNVMSIVKDVISMAWSLIKTIWNNGLSQILGFCGSILASIVGSFTSKLNLVTSVVKTAIALVKAIFSGDFNAVSKIVNTVLNKIVAGFYEKMNNAKDKVKTAIDKIKGFFNFKWSLPKIKLPHFSVSGSANPIDWLSKGVPKIKVEWYKNGGIMQKPTMFGFNPLTNSAMVGGEAGPEAILPLDRIQGYFDKAFENTMSKVSNNENSEIYLNINIDQFINNREQDIKALVEEIAFYLKRKNIALGGK